MTNDFDEHGEDTIKKLRENSPANYCQVIGRLMPKLMELSGPDGDEIPLDWKWTVEIVEPGDIINAK